jgi:hypothetical protein
MAMLLLSTTGDASGESELRYARIGAGRKVSATGMVRLADLPAGEARLSFYSRIAFFSHVTTEKSTPKMLPIQVRRLIDAELAFNEPFRARQRTSDAGEGRQNLAIAAVAEADFTLVTAHLPLVDRPFACVTPTECVLAALLAQVTQEPTRVLWRRANQLLGLLVAGGVVHARHAARVENDVAQDEADFAARVLPLLAATAGRLNTTGPGRDVVVTLALGEWSHLPEGVDNKIGSGICSQLEDLFPSAPASDVRAWPELYGLPFVAAEFNFLPAEYQAEVDGVRYAKPVMWAAAAVAAVYATITGFAAIQTNSLNTQLATRRADITTSVQNVSGKLPSPGDIETLKRRLGVQNALDGIRLDRFLAWVSKNTPKDMHIRALDVSRAAGAPPAANQAVADPATTPAQSWNVAIVYEVPGPYADAERKAAAAIAALGSKTKLISSQLSVGVDATSRLSIALVTQETVFSE